MAASTLGDRTLDVGGPLDDESLKVYCTPDNVAAIADWLEDNKEKGVADDLQTPGAEGPKQE